MKNSHVAILVLGAVGMTAGFQEWRMASLKRSIESVEGGGVSARTPPARTCHVEDAGEPRRRAVAVSGESNGPAEEGQEFTRTIRRMWHNSAGKALMNQGVKIAIAMMYEDYIETLGLTGMALF